MGEEKYSSLREIIVYSLRLFTICAISAGMLSFANFIAEPRIYMQKQKAIKQNLKLALPQATSFRYKKLKEIKYFMGYDAKGKFIGYAFIVKERGYSSQIETLIGVSPEGKIISLNVLFQNETPGLGTQITSKNFQERFKNLSYRDLNKVETITGATISSKAVIKAAKEALGKILKFVRENE